MKNFKTLEKYEKELKEKIKANEFWEGETSDVTWYFNIDENVAKEILEKLVKEGLLIKRYGIICEKCGEELELEKWQIEKIGRLSPETIEKLGTLTCQVCWYSFKPKDIHLTIFYRTKNLPIDERYIVR